MPAVATLSGIDCIAKVTS